MCGHCASNVRRDRNRPATPLAAPLRPGVLIRRSKAPLSSPNQPESEAIDAPLFARVLGDGWSDLGAIIRRHYFLRACSGDRVTVSGTMDEVYLSPAAKLLSPLSRMVGALVPYGGTDIPIEVHYEAPQGSEAIHWDRVFRFPGRAPYHFRSRMVMVEPGEIIEFVRFNIGLRMRVTAEDGALVFRDTGYVWRLGSIDLPIPGRLLLGRAYVEERPEGEDRFSMRMNLRHPLLGELFRYSGRFTMGEPHRGSP